MLPKKISSLQHPIVKYLVKLRNEREMRKKESLVLISGNKLINEIALHQPLHTLLFEQDFNLPTSLKASHLYSVSKEIMKKITGLLNPEELCATVELPKYADLNKKKWIIVLDRISDPGNLGTLLRTALALGWEGVFILDSCVDPFNEKALRAAKGANFKLPLAEGNLQDLVLLIQKNKMQPYIADTKGSDVSKIKMHPPLVLILGHESHGVRDDLKEAYPSICIPIKKEIESLNVSIAGGILMYMMKQKAMR